MTDFGGRIRSFHQLEAFALGKTAIHRLHPFTKLCASLLFIILISSFGRYDFPRLAPYLFYPALITALAEIPYRALIPKLLIALPFCLFAGISNAFFDRVPAFLVMEIAISYGVLSLLTILMKMYLCVSAALLLIATTPLTELAAQLRRLRVPHIFVMIFEMTYRYIGVLLEEARSMTTAYHLRSAGKRALEMRHMGSLLGQLILRGFDRAERVYAAMTLRGYARREIPRSGAAFRVKDGVILGGFCALTLLLRFIKIG